MNELKERVGQKQSVAERLTDLEVSVDSAIANVASGSIALLAKVMK